jgi:hypothetical protein
MRTNNSRTDPVGPPSEISSRPPAVRTVGWDGAPAIWSSFVSRSLPAFRVAVPVMARCGQVPRFHMHVSIWATQVAAIATPRRTEIRYSGPAPERFGRRPSASGSPGPGSGATTARRKTMKTQSQKPGGTTLLISAGAQAAAQGPIHSARLTQPLPFAGMAALAVRLFRKNGDAETRPAAGYCHEETKHGCSMDAAWSRPGVRARSVPCGLPRKGGAAS